MDFSEKVKNHKISEKEMFSQAYKEIMKSSIGKETNKGEKKLISERRELQLAAAIDKVTDFYGINRILITKMDAEDSGALDTTLGRTGLTRREVALRRGWWTRGEGPIITNTTEGNIVAVLPLKFGGYYYNDPKTDRAVKINKDSAKNLNNTGYCFYKPFPNQISMTIKDLLKHIFKSFSKFDIAFLAVVSIIVSLMGLILPKITQEIYNRVIPSGTINDIFPMAALLVGVTIGSTTFALFQSMWISRIGDKVQFGTQGALWIRLLNLPIGFFKNFSSGDLAVRTFRLNQICSSISSDLLPTALSALFSFVYLWQISTLSADLLLPTIIIIAFMLGSSLLSGYFNTQLNKRASEVSPKLSGLVYQLFSGISKIKVSGAEIRAFSKWANLYSKLSKIQFSPNLFIKISGAINGAIGLGGTMLIYWIVYSKGLAPADYIAFNAAFGLFSASILQISGIATEIAFLKPSVELLEPILKEVPESNENRIKVDSITGKIDINNVKFRYTPDGPLIIDDLNLSFKQGEYVGIVGSTGCGKSTLFRLLLGFEKAQGGGIYFDNQSLEKLDLHSVRRRIGIVLQNGKLFADSIFSNITITNPAATMDDAWAAAEKAGCAGDIKAMPMGMHTMVSEDGGGISGGQKQRIMIARALISSPDLLMFDEATSALDNITQKIVVDTLEKMDITRVVIAHRLSTIKKCDRIVYLHKGKVVEQGSYDELMALDGYFAELAKRQIV
ncbi:MAG: NHLP bacteriocin export ABC transporter permease/ATPase subunit [Eubacteriales bacterium SKADARSKE-1]|nr:NHLP bacteriocin export ABC transporter permease/ATPase subunit [Eubacteriales bacterium SKADARSKE-1]